MLLRFNKVILLLIAKEKRRSILMLYLIKFQTLKALCRCDIYNVHGIAVFPTPVDIVIVHDAVRPFIPADVIVNVVEAAKQHGVITYM